MKRKNLSGNWSVKMGKAAVKRLGITREELLGPHFEE